MATATRSFREPVGKNHSSLAKMSTLGGESASKRTKGVGERAAGDFGAINRRRPMEEW